MGGDHGSIVPVLFELVVTVLLIASMWRVFDKAGQPGWAAIIPIYSGYVLCEVADKPGWWVLLMFVPLVNLIIWILVSLGVADQFGKGAGFGVGLMLLPFIFYPILAFTEA